MKKLIQEELKALNENIDVVVTKLQDGSLSVAGIFMAHELIATMQNMHDWLKTNGEVEKDKAIYIMQKLPLLYFQIPKIS